MTYRFKTQNTADTLLLHTDGDTLLRAMGIQPAPQGILLSVDIPSAIARIAAAIEADEAGHGSPSQSAEQGDLSVPQEEPVSLRQRAWPLLEMLRRAHAEGDFIVWEA